MTHEFNDIAIDSVAPPRMTDDEARAVIALWQSEQMDSPQSARPTPADMAEGLGIETADAVRLLGQVRVARDAERQVCLAARQEELARAETEARLAEARARQAEAEARAKSNTRVQVPDANDYYYVRRKKMTPAGVIILIMWFILLFCVVSAVNHSQKHSHSFSTDMHTTCGIDGTPVPCAQIGVHDISNSQK